MGLVTKIVLSPVVFVLGLIAVALGLAVTVVVTAILGLVLSVIVTIAWVIGREMNDVRYIW